MTEAAKLSHTAALILQAIGAGEGYGFSVMEMTGLPSGTVYPAMRRLERDGLIRSQWERQSIADAATTSAPQVLQADAFGAGNAGSFAEALSAAGDADVGPRGGHAMKIPLILRCAAWIVPIEDRSEWLAEWGGEAAHVRRWCKRARLTAFCLGAFPDALWLRRNHQSARGIFCIESPVRCLVVLAILAAASVSFAAWRAQESAPIWPSPYRDAEKLAMISHHRRHAPQFAEIPVEEYRLSAKQSRAGVEEVAFYATRTVGVVRNRFVLGVASPNLFEVLGMRTPTPGLVLSSGAWRRRFKGDPHLVGRAIEVGGVRAEVTGIISEGAWQLPGFVDAWLLDESRLEALSPDAKGFMVARLRTEASCEASLAHVRAQ